MMAKGAASPILQLIRRVVEDPKVRELPDGDLLQRFHAQQDQAAFHTLLRRHGPMVLDVCRGVLGDGPDAEDAFQATFLVLAQKAGWIRKGASLGSWLHGVAHRTALKARAQSAARQKHEARAPEPQASEADDLNWREVRQVLHEELGGISERYREALVMCYLEGVTQQRAAARLGLAERTLRERLERGRELLRVRLVRRGLGPVAVLAVAAWPMATASAAVPSLLLNSTVKAATVLAVEGAVPPVVSAKVTALAEGVVRAMFMTKLKIPMAVLSALAVVAGGLLFQTQAAEQKGASDQAATENGKPEQRELSPRFLKGEKGDLWISYLAWGPAGKTLAAVTLDATDDGKSVRIDGCAVRLWDVLSGRVKCTLVDQELKKPLWTNAGIAFSPDGKTVAAKGDQAGLDDPGWLVLWDAETGRVKHRLNHTKHIREIAFSPDGGTVAAEGPDADETEAIRLWDVRTGHLQRAMKTAGKRVSGVVFSPDGKKLGACHERGRNECRLVLWEVASGKRLLVLPDSDGFGGITFAPDGKSVLGFAQEKRQWRAWNAETGAATRTWDLQADFSKESPIRFAASPDGKMAIAGKQGKDDVVALFDVQTGKQTKTLNGPGGLITGLVFSPDGQVLAAGARDGRICLWDVGKMSKQSE